METLNYPVNEYQLFAVKYSHGRILLRRVPQQDGSDQWFITDGRNVLTCGHGWIWQPAETTESFLTEISFASAAEAVEHWESLPDEVKFKTMPYAILR